MKARIVRIAYNLMSEVRDEILLNAAQSSDEAVKEAEQIDEVMHGG